MRCRYPCRYGHVAEWLRSGLQNRLPRFNSGRGLQLSVKFAYRRLSETSADAEIRRVVPEARRFGAVTLHLSFKRNKLSSCS